ncbi:outer membrane beta-barrel protein [Maribacter flavus]|uniref:Outer membrane protein beta-barrel domain-containing protein n=1 Tax=Maribacter flavus TaxID=1658664 RepID=A0A5B2TYT8_9FLAO|nr:outer membrane beta-barrel protein [Maribacter flavus]KAA2219178.1 hypothetical protein F0361_06080 [Maribacter flavus]
MSKKHLDELFQERFKGFEETPDEKVWSAIEASLDKKRKKRILPLWWQLAGVAAVLIVGLLLFNPFNSKVSPDTHIITDTEQTDETPQLSKDPIQTKNENGRETEMNRSAESKDGSNTIDETSVADTDTDSDGTISTNKVVNSADAQSNIHSGRSYSEATKQDGQQITKNTGIAEQSLTKKDGQNTEVASVYTTQSNDTQENGTSEDAVSGTGEVVLRNETIVSAEKNKNPETKGVDEKKSLYEEIQAMEEEEKVASRTSGNRWSAGPSIAPVYFDAIGTGSPVSPMFSTNSKSGNVNMSYGLSVAYEISPKLSVRSGVHKVDYGYNTNDVFFTSSLSAAFNENRIVNINYAETAENIVVSASNATLNVDSKSFDVSARSANRSGVMAQQLGYLEVPVEVSYALVNNKFGVHVIGGVSSLFLVDNDVDLTSGNLTTQIGEANNVNDLNFSANLGIGLGYQFSQRLKLNVEPVFKYQLNTFSNVDGTFNPYTIGVYSGISFKF